MATYCVTYESTDKAGMSRVVSLGHCGSRSRGVLDAMDGRSQRRGCRDRLAVEVLFLGLRKV